jgi:hypothetical protein
MRALGNAMAGFMRGMLAAADPAAADEQLAAPGGRRLMQEEQEVRGDCLPACLPAWS